MDLFGMNSGYYDQVYGMPYDHHRHSHFGHELLGGAAAFAAFKLYERRQAQNGQPIRHAGAKSAIAALVGFEITKLFEDNRYRHIDMDMARMHAEQQCMMMYDQQYGGGFDPGIGYQMGMDPYAMGGGYGGGFGGAYGGGFGGPFGGRETIERIDIDQGGLFGGRQEEITTVQDNFGPFGGQESIQRVDIDQGGLFGGRREEITDIRYDQGGFGGGFNRW